MIGKYLSTFDIDNVLGSTWRGGDGDSHRQLVKQLAMIHGCRHVILFQSARCALQAFLRTLGTSGKAILPAYNCIAVPEAVQRVGWRPVFADIAFGDINMTHDTLANNLPADARVVILTHQFGIPPAIEPIMDLCRRRGLFVVEDVAPAIGARYRGRPVGQFGDAAVVSFQLTKVVGAGRAGALLTNDEDIAAKVQSLQIASLNSGQELVDMVAAAAWWAVTRPSVYGTLRNAWGLLHHDELYEEVIPSTPSPASSFSSCSKYVAELASRQMASLDSNLSNRRILANVYLKGLYEVKGITIPEVPEGAEPAWMQFPIFVENKEACHRFLLKHGVDLSWTFRYSCGVSYNVKNTPNAERAARTLLGLPTYPGLTTKDASRICELLHSFSRRC